MTAQAALAAWRFRTVLELALSLARPVKVKTAGMLQTAPRDWSVWDLELLANVIMSVTQAIPIVL